MLGAPLGSPADPKRPAAPIPDVGDWAVDFTLPSTRGEVQLSRLLGAGAALLVFYPKDHTMVCTQQLCNYRDSLSEFERLEVQIVAVNDEPLERHQAFAARYGFPFPLAADEERQVCRAYGALTDLLRAKRTLVLIGEDGRIWWRHSEFRLFHRGAEELLGVIDSLRRQR